MYGNEYDPKPGDTVAGTAMSIARASLFRVIGSDKDRFTRVCVLHTTAMSGFALTRNNTSLSPYSELELKDALHVNEKKIRQHLSENDTELAIYASRIVAAEIARQVNRQKQRVQDVSTGDQLLCLNVEVA